MAKVWLEHVHIVTPDPMKLAAFYQNTFDAKITRKGTLPNGAPSVSLDLGGFRLAIMAPDTPDKREPSNNPHKHFGLEHLGVRTDDIETVVKRAKIEGATVIQDVTEVRPGHRVAFILAPENTMIEIGEAN
jgi:catechol 2,3-dioxygenase-like lactoylglutathione lyase family enzyme